MADQKIANPVRLVDTSGGTPNTVIIDNSGRLSVLATGSGTAGTPAAGVLTVQGISSMTALKVDGSGFTQPVSGTITANIGTSGSLALDASVTGLQVAQSATTSGQKGGLILGAVTTAAPSYTTAQSNPLSLTTSGLLRVDGSGVTQPVSGTVTANAGTGTFAISAASLPLPTGAATAVKQPAIGTAGSASVDVITVQGISSMTALKVDGSAVTQPVSGTITANIGTSGSLALDATVAKLTVAQNAALGSNTQVLNGASVTTAAPTYTTGNIQPLSLSTSGALRVDIGATSVNGTAIKVDGSAVTQPVSGTVTANAGTGTFAVSGTVTANIGTSGSLALDATVAKVNVAQGAATGSNTGPMIQGVATTGAPSYTTATVNPFSLDTAGNLRVNVVTGGSSGTVAQSSTTSGQSGNLVQGAVTTAAPTYTTAQTNPLSLTTAGALRVDIGATSVNGTAIKVDGSAVTQPVSGTFWQATQPVSGTVTANAGTGTFAISAASLPLPAGAATAAKQPALGTAGSASADVITVQGIASMTPLSVAITSGGGETTPTAPIAIRNTATIAAGASTTTAVQTADLGAGTYYCAGFDASSSVPIKVELYTVLAGVQATNPITTLFIAAGAYTTWKPPHRSYTVFTSAAGAGQDGYRLVITNMDTSETADVYGTIYYQTN